MNRREFVTLAGVGGAIACLPEVVSAETANFVAVGTVKELDKTGKLQVTSTPNQDNPLMPKQIISGTPILNLDVWEHAYYLDYQYKRKKYIENFFKIINWKKVTERYEEATAKATP